MCVQGSTRQRSFLLKTLFASLLAVFQISASSADSAPILEQVKVLGERDAAYAIPGSAHYIDYEQFRAMSYDDINRILREVPGVYVREEDGYGLFPNISLRGVDTSRSAKVTLMEDGVLAAPAPYAAPSAYYSPTSGRMAGLEVLKGTSQVMYGPHTTGGVINYLSTPIPDSSEIFVRTQYGSEGDTRLHAYAGTTTDTDLGLVGVLVEGYFRDVEGFKTIDSAPGFTNTDETGFRNTEPMIKVAWEPRTSIYQRVEIKYGRTEKTANETYLGLSEADFQADPYRRYAASRFDNIDTEHDRFYLRHFISLASGLDMVTTAYRNEFARNWYKLNDIRSVAGGLSENLNMSSALAGASNGEGLACLRGEIACGLRVRANNRAYEARGIQSDVKYRVESGTIRHRFAFGVRVHEDVERRFQWQDVYIQSAGGAISSVSAGIPGSQDNREAETQAFAVYLQDTIESGDWTFQPGIRYERLDLQNRDFRPGGTTRDAELSMISGGIGATWRLSPTTQLLGGVHRGFSPPSPGGAVNGLNEETSTGYEFGFRFQDEAGISSAEVIWFQTGFEDLIVVSNIGGTGTGTDENFGEVDSSGLEFSGTFDLGRLNGWSFSNKYFAAFTYTDAEQKNDARSTDPESIFSFGARGNKVPYIPDYQLTLGASLEYASWGLDLVANLVDETYASASNNDTQTNGVGDPDARFGKLDAYEVIDVSIFAKPWKRVKLFAGIHNLLDEAYIVSRQPHGPRPGMPQTWYAGVEFDLK